MERKFDLIFSPFSSQDWFYNKIVKSSNSKNLSFYSLEHLCGPIKDQKDTGFCHSFAGSSLKDIQEKLETGINYNLSPLYLAKKVKEIDNITNTEGSTLINVCKALQEEGDIKEIYYPFDDKYKTGSLKFPELNYNKIPKYKISNYARCDTIESIKDAICNNKPVLLGITCCENIYDLDNNKDKFIPLPKGLIKGGHALLIVGYDDNLEHTYLNNKTCKGFFRIQNSWGKEWGDKGFAWLPYEYFDYKVNVIGNNYMTFINEAWTCIDLKNDQINTIYIKMQINNNEVEINEKKYYWEQPPIIDKKTSRTLVPLRNLSEILNYSVEWQEKDKIIILTKELE